MVNKIAYHKKQRNRGIIAFIVVIVLAVGAYFYEKRKKKSAASPKKLKGTVSIGEMTIPIKMGDENMNIFKGLGNVPDNIPHSWDTPAPHVTDLAPVQPPAYKNVKYAYDEFSRSPFSVV